MTLQAPCCNTVFLCHLVLCAPPAFFQLLPWPLATPTPITPWLCPPGKEPDLVSHVPSCPRMIPEGRGEASTWIPRGFWPGFRPCNLLPLPQDPGQGTLCRTCPLGTFSASWDSYPCQPHHRCSLQKRLEAQAGTATQDTKCGDCQRG